MKHFGAILDSGAVILANASRAKFDAALARYQRARIMQEPEEMVKLRAVIGVLRWESKQRPPEAKTKRKRK